MGRPRKPRSGLRLRYNTVPHPHNRSRRSTSRTVSDPFALRRHDSRPFQVHPAATPLDSIATGPGSEPNLRLPEESPSEALPTSMSPDGLLAQEGNISFADSEGIQLDTFAELVNDLVYAPGLGDDPESLPKPYEFDHDYESDSSQSEDSSSIEYITVE